MDKQQKSQSGPRKRVSRSKSQGVWPEEVPVVDGKGISASVLQKIQELATNPQHLLRFALIYFVEQWSVEQAAGAATALAQINARLKQLRTCPALTGPALAWGTGALRGHFVENVRGFLESGGGEEEVQDVLDAVVDSLHKRDLDKLRQTAQRMSCAKSVEEQEAWAAMYDSAMLAAATAEGDEGSIEMLQQRKADREATAAARYSAMAAAAKANGSVDQAADDRKPVAGAGEAAGEVKQKQGSKKKKGESHAKDNEGSKESKDKGQEVSEAARASAQAQAARAAVSGAKVPVPASEAGPAAAPTVAAAVTVASAFMPAAAAATLEPAASAASSEPAATTAAASAPAASLSNGGKPAVSKLAQVKAKAAVRLGTLADRQLHLLNLHALAQPQPLPQPLAQSLMNKVAPQQLQEGPPQAQFKLAPSQLSTRASSSQLRRSPSPLPAKRRRGVLAQLRDPSCVMPSQEEIKQRFEDVFRILAEDEQKEKAGTKKKRRTGNPEFDNLSVEEMRQMLDPFHNGRM